MGGNCDALIGENDENVYIFYGLPFTNLYKPYKKENRKIVKSLLDTYYNWLRYSDKNNDDKIKDTGNRFSKWVQCELRENFDKEVSEIFSNGKNRRS